MLPVRTAEWRSRLTLRLMVGGLTSAICAVVYRTLQHYHLGVSLVRHDCAAWRWIEFSPSWTWLYASFFLAVAVAWCVVPVNQLWTYSRHILGTAAPAWLFFIFMPTACARPLAQELAPWYYRCVLVLDGPENCFPCLHTALGLIAGVAIVTHTPGTSRRIVALLVAVWFVAMNTAVLGLRQHTGVDIAGGFVLGACTSALYVLTTLRSTVRPAPATAGVM